MKRTVPATAIVLMIVFLAFGMLDCSKAPLPTTVSPTAGGPGGGAIINSDSIISGQMKAIRKEATGYPWEVDVLVQSSDNVDNLPNPTKDKVGQVITAKAEQDLTLFKVGQAITARVKYVGDVPRPGIFLFIYDIVPK